MKKIQQLTPDDTSVRTQITLTRRLKELIEQEIKPKNVSLSEYLRQASMIKLYLDRQEKTDLKELADRVVGSLDLKNHPEWSSEKKIIEWQKKERASWSKHG